MSESSGGGCGGCLVFILLCLLAAAFWGGVDINGKRYELDCGCSGIRVSTPGN